MKRLVMAAMIVSSMMAARAEAGLVWTATASLSVRPRPGVEGVESVRATGIHRVTVTDMGAFIEFFIRVQDGSLNENAFPLDGCSTGWQFISEVSSVACVTRVVQSPCVDGVWEALTIGQIKFVTLFKRTKIAQSPAIFVNCSCV